MHGNNISTELRIPANRARFIRNHSVWLTRWNCLTKRSGRWLLLSILRSLLHAFFVYTVILIHIGIKTGNNICTHTHAPTYTLALRGPCMCMEQRMNSGTESRHDRLIDICVRTCIEHGTQLYQCWMYSGNWKVGMHDWKMLYTTVYASFLQWMILNEM